MALFNNYFVLNNTCTFKAFVLCIHHGLKVICREILQISFCPGITIQHTTSVNEVFRSHVSRDFACFVLVEGLSDASLQLRPVTDVLQNILWNSTYQSVSLMDAVYKMFSDRSYSGGKRVKSFV